MATVMVPTMHPTHLELLRSVTSPALHPDGWAVAAVTRPDFAADAYVGQLWRIPLDSSPPRRITRGFLDREPRISPDGELIAFLRAAAGGRPQLAVVPASGGEPVLVTDAPLGVSEFDFTPDSSRLVFIAAVPEPGRYGTVEGVGAGAEDPRRLTGLQVRMNGRGWLPDQRRHVFVVDVPDPFGEPPVTPVGRSATEAKPVLVPTARQLTSGDHDHQSLAVTPTEAIVVSARHRGREFDLRADLFAVPLSPAPDADAGVRAITGPLADGRLLAALSPVVAGETLFFRAVDCGTSGREFVGVDSALYRVPLAGGEPELLTDPATTDLMDLRPDGSGTGALVVIGERGVGVAARALADGSLDRLAVPSCCSVVGIAGDGRTVVAAVATPDSPGELFVLGEGARVLTDFGAALHEATAAVPPVELVATAPDGAQVHGWVLVPPGPGPHPVLLTIHGGPFASYGPCFFDEVQTWAGAGYAVVMCNPRGSSGYGEAHGRAIEGAMGDRDAVDVLAFLDHAIARVPGLDGDRVGVMGGSYGGYLTAWLIAHEHRFAAAVVERAYLDPRSFVGASDIGWFFPAGYHRDKAGMDAQSPLLLADQVRTPTLVLHSEEDLRCPLAEALRYYTELRLAGVESELLVFPGENHELSRSGRPVHRRQRLEAILSWWARYLPVAASPDGGAPAV